MLRKINNGFEALDFKTNEKDKQYAYCSELSNIAFHD